MKSGTNIQDIIGTFRIIFFSTIIENPNLVVPKIKATRFFLIFEEIGQQLLDSKHMLTLGQLFKIALDLKQYVIVKQFLAKKIVIPLRPNLKLDGYGYIIVIHVHVHKNIIKDVLLDEGSRINIMMKDLKSG